MEFIKEWTLTVCISLIIAVIFSVLSPNGSMNRFFKVLISIFVFVSFLVPLKDFKSIDFDFSEIGITNEVESSQNSAAENLINTEIKELLKNKGIMGVNVTTSAKYNINNGEITVNDVQVSVPDTYDKDETQKLIFDELGINVRVINVGS